MREGRGRGERVGKRRGRRGRHRRDACATRGRREEAQRSEYASHAAMWARAIAAVMSQKEGLRFLWWRVRMARIAPGTPKRREKRWRVFSGVRRRLWIAARLSRKKRENVRREERV
jgi:hypothetical protein